jgi:hypothetical protein
MRCPVCRGQLDLSIHKLVAGSAYQRNFVLIKSTQCFTSGRGVLDRFLKGLNVPERGMGIWQVFKRAHQTRFINLVRILKSSLKTGHLRTLFPISYVIKQLELVQTGQSSGTWSTLLPTSSLSCNPSLSILNAARRYYTKSSVETSMRR